MKWPLRTLGIAQALCILWAYHEGHASIQVPLMRNPSLAGTFVALTLFEFPLSYLGALSVGLTTRHIPIAVFVLTWGWNKWFMDP